MELSELKYIKPFLPHHIKFDSYCIHNKNSYTQIDMAWEQRNKEKEGLYRYTLRCVQAQRQIISRVIYAQTIIIFKRDLSGCST